VSSLNARFCQYFAFWWQVYASLCPLYLTASYSWNSIHLCRVVPVLDKIYEVCPRTNVKSPVKSKVKTFFEIFFLHDILMSFSNWYMFFSAQKNSQQGQNKVLKTCGTPYPVQEKALKMALFQKNVHNFGTIDPTEMVHISN